MSTTVSTPFPLRRGRHRGAVSRQVVLTMLGSVALSVAVTAAAVALVVAPW